MTATGSGDRQGERAAQDELAQILQPQGIKTFTTGADEVGQYLLGRYGTLAQEEVQRRFREDLARLPAARAVLLGVPMDAGAGFERGAFKGPLGVRSQFLAAGFYERLASASVLDLGDVRVNPSLLSDDLLDEATLRSVRRDRYGAAAEHGALPVSPLSILERALRLIRAQNPRARVHLLGGDHSLTWIPIKVLVETTGAADLGIVHFDAHTDLLELRDGLRYSFATWAFHANEAIGRGGRLQQLGIRTSGRSREAWERELSLRQFWSEEILERGDEAVLDELCANLRRAGVRRVYVSNDIDGTDPRFGAATGTLVEGGMTPGFVRAVIARVAREFAVVGCDVTELAPPLKWHVPGEPARSTQLAAGYVAAQLDALLGEPGLLGGAFPIPEPVSAEEVRAFPRYAGPAARSIK